MAQSNRVGAEAKVEAGAKPPSRGLAFVFSLFVPGMGHVYLGHWRRALLWVCAPSLLLWLFCACTILVPLRWAFAWLVPALVLVAGLAWCGAAIDVWLLPCAHFRRTAWWKLPLFWLGSLLLSVSAASVARRFVLQAFKIPGGSMEPALMARDHVFVNMRAFRAPPRRGQLAVFTLPDHEDQDFLKRVIGLPGDRLSVSGGHPTINGWPVPHCPVGRVRLPESEANGRAPGEVELEFLGEQAFLIINEERGGPVPQGPWIVPANEVFVLGDNRSNSYDSRVWFNGEGGGVPFAKLIGQPMFVWLAFKSDGSVDWSRWGLPLDEPTLGNWAAELAARLRDCLAERPPRSKTEPPPAVR